MLTGLPRFARNDGVELLQIKQNMPSCHPKLSTTLQSWIDHALAQPGVELLPLSSSIAVESAQLPEGFHGDPADRIIVATARIHALTLLTRDEKIIQYAKLDFLTARKS